MNVARRTRIVSLAFCMIATQSIAQLANASGMYLVDRGVRPMGRAGAFVAGADDLSSIWYNPAGLAGVGRRAAFDMSYLMVSSEFQREMRIVDADQTIRHVRSPIVRGTSPLLPIPNMGLSFPLGRNSKWTLAFGMTIPNIALPSYPETVGGLPSPTRNPKVGIALGSIAAYPGLWIAYELSPAIRLGAGVQILAARIRGNARFTANIEDRVLGAPEQPDHDIHADFTLGPFIAPSANIGAQFLLSSTVRLGASFQAPTLIQGPIAFDARLPTGLSPTSNTIAGEGHFRLTLPAIARVGIECRPAEMIRIEAAYVREFWSMHDSIEVEAKNLDLASMLGPSHKADLSPFAVPRGFVDASSLRLGGEIVAAHGTNEYQIRAGISRDSSAVPTNYVSTMSLDASKVTATIGAGIRLNKTWRFDVVYAHVFMPQIQVDPKTAKVGRIDPFAGSVPLEAINGGTYRTSGNLFGVGGEVAF